MTDLQSNRLDMYIVVSDFYGTNQAAIDVVTARTTAFGQLTTNINAIRALAANQSATLSGVAQDKTVLRTALNELTFSILSPARAWALANSDNTNANEFNHSPSDLRAIKDDLMGSFCTHRHSIITANLASMADYGITAPILASWATAISDYEAALGRPRTAVIQRGSYTGSLRNLFTATNRLFKQTIDPLMVPFSLSDPTLYANYQRARIIINRRGRSTGSGTPTVTGTVSGIITDKVTGLPITGAQVARTPGTATATTDAAGRYNFNNVQPVASTVTASASGYVTASKAITPVGGADTRCDIALDPQ